MTIFRDQMRCVLFGLILVFSRRSLSVVTLKRIALTFLVLCCLSFSDANIVFLDDFEDDTVGSLPVISGSNIGDSYGAVVNDMAVTANPDSSVGSGNESAQVLAGAGGDFNANNIPALLSEPVSIDGLTISYDFYCAAEGVHTDDSVRSSLVGNTDSNRDVFMRNDRDQLIKVDGTNQTQTNFGANVWQNWTAVFTKTHGAGHYDLSYVVTNLKTGQTVSGVQAVTVNTNNFSNAMLRGILLEAFEGNAGANSFIGYIDNVEVSRLSTVFATNSNQSPDIYETLQDGLHQIDAHWVRAFDSKVVSRIGQGPPNINTDAQLHGFKDAHDAGFKVIYSLKFYLDGVNGRPEMTDFAPGSANEQGLFTALEDLLDVMGPYMNVLVVGNEPIVESAPSSFVQSLQADWGGVAGYPIVIFYDRMSDHVLDYMADKPQFTHIEVYCGSLNGLYRRTNAVINGYTKSFIEMVDQKPGLVGLDIHIHSDDEVGGMPDLNYQQTRDCFEIARMFTDKPLMVTEFSLVWRYQNHLSDPLGIDAAGQQFAAQYGYDPAMKVVDYINACVSNPVTRSEWVDFCDSRTWWQPHYLLDMHEIFSKYGVRYAAYRFEQNQKHFFDEDSTPWNLNAMIYRAYFDQPADRYGEGYAFAEDFRYLNQDIAPTPNPMRLVFEPNAVDFKSVRMVAARAIDPAGVEYYFECTSGNGHDSGWQFSPEYIDTNLQPETTYTYRVKARDLHPNRNETAYSASVSTTTPREQWPYLGSPFSPPCRIEAEDFDEGGEGAAYHDTSPSGGGDYRPTEGVEILNATDDGGGYAVYTSNGEWVEYTLGPVEGAFALELRVACGFSGRQINILVDGESFGTVDVPNTSSSHVYQTVHYNGLLLSGSEKHILRLEFPYGGFNLNWIDLVEPTPCEAAQIQPGYVSPVGDLNEDCYVNADDLNQMASAWLTDYFMDDFATLAKTWMEQTIIP